MIDPWLRGHLVCPRCHEALTLDGDWLSCRGGHRYPVIDDIPVMVLDNVEQTHWVATHALEHYRDAAADAQPSDGTIDPVVQQAGSGPASRVGPPLRVVNTIPLVDQLPIDGE